jgi:enoyl-CoA hydratase/carnithine racemase
MQVDHGWQSNHTDADEDDFLKQENALTAALRWFAKPVVAGFFLGLALYFIGRAAGLF